MATLVAAPCRRTQTLGEPKKRQLDIGMSSESDSESRATKLQRHESTPHIPSASIFGFETGPLTRHFSLDAEPIGSGRFGVVRRCILRETGETFACKTIQKSGLVTEADRDEIRQEVALMQRLAGCPGVVQLRAVFESTQEVHLVMELCEGGELFDEVVRSGRLAERDAARIFRQLLLTVSHCHSQGVLHRDLKPENILLSASTAATAAGKPVLAKLADFGLAVALQPGESVVGAAGSPFYMAPEVLTGAYGFEADVWSLGVILYVLLSGRTPFWGADDKTVFASILNEHVDFSGPEWAGISVEAKGLIRCMLNKDARRRPSAAKILSHPWILVHAFGGRVVRKVVGQSTAAPAALAARGFSGAATAAVAASGA